MLRTHAFCLALCACGTVIAAMPAAAQVAAPTPATPVGPAAAFSAATPAEPGPARRVAEPNVQRIVKEDDNVRIDELRVRGQTREIVVHHKAVAGSRYEILPGEGGRDPSTQDKRSGGQSVWRLFSF
jgi:hypothetical protein